MKYGVGDPQQRSWGEFPPGQFSIRRKASFTWHPPKIIWLSVNKSVYVRKLRQY